MNDAEVHEKMKFVDMFSSSYELARERFRSLSKTHQGQCLSYSIDQVGSQGENLSIDVSRFGRDDAKKLLVISSGTHGIEGFFGSAVQLAMIEHKMASYLSDPDCAVLLIHAVNPYGFSHLRRVNEDNVDLNRNFLLEHEEYEGSPDRYASLDPLLNPKTPPKSELFFLRAVYRIIRHGFRALKAAVAGGQYEFEQGLFFGGYKASKSNDIVTTHLSDWIGGAEKVIHLDFHTGLGASGSYVLAASQNIPDTDMTWLMKNFDQTRVQNLDAGGVLYQIRGEFTYYCRHICTHTQYYPILAEFGTYPILKVLHALREENRATHWASEDDQLLKMTRRQLKEVFVPSSPSWRETVVKEALTIVDHSLKALSEEVNRENE